MGWVGVECVGGLPRFATWLSRAALFLATTLGLIGLLADAPASAHDDSHVPPGPARWEMASGVDATANSWFSYGSATLAPFGSSLESGLRLRAGGGAGLYRYRGSIAREGTRVPVLFRGRTSLAEALLGYQLKWGAITAKAFVGVQFQSHVITPFDAGNPVEGEKTGLKLALESWTDLGPRTALVLDANYATAFSSYWARVRLDRRIFEKLAVGGELGSLGNAAFAAGRAGLYLRYQTGFAEISLSGGVSGDYVDPSALYGGLNLFRRF